MLEDFKIKGIMTYGIDDKKNGSKFKKRGYRKATHNIRGMKKCSIRSSMFIHPDQKEQQSIDNEYA